MKALIKVGYGCNDHCAFCHTLDLRHVDGTDAEVMRRIERARELGHSTVVLSGGEPTIRPALMRWARRVADLDMDFGLVTNGRMLSYPELVEALLRHRLRYVYLSLHGGSARIHDRMVRAQGFDQTYAALGNLSGRGLDLTVNCVVTRHNVEHLTGFIDATLPFEDLVVKLSMVEPKGGARHRFEQLVPPITLVAEKVREAIDRGRARVAQRGGIGPRFAHGAIPSCLMQGYEGLGDDLKTHGFRSMVEVGEEDFFPVDDRNKVQPPDRCAGCAMSGPCPGLYREYHRVFGAGELAPIRGRPRSNSFNYVLQEWFERDAGGDRCPLLEALGVSPWDRGRDLFLRRGGRLSLFRAPGRDFSDAQVEGVKHGAGQVYLDVSSKDAPDDFARDLVKLRRCAMCGPCPQRAACTGLFEPVAGDVFAPDDARVRELIAALEGEVLDVGCGEGRYEALLSRRVAQGALVYHGLDPDARRVAALRARWPWAHLVQGGAEDLPEAQVACFDHVLVLRSWNHLVDPDRALSRLAAALRPGGTLTVVDNVAFGLARTPAQRARGETSKAAFEHYRNDDAPAAQAVIARLGLELIERRDVTPATSNQWLLRFRRLAGR